MRIGIVFTLLFRQAKMNINADDLRTTLAEFDSIWSSLIAREQE
jgi:hypothetical protein